MPVHTFPACFPSDFGERILPKDLPKIELHVYRICTNGIINKDAFMSTFEEILLGRKPRPMKWEKMLDDPSTYSTSCDTDLRGIKNVMKCLKKYYPAPIISSGDATFLHGPASTDSG